MWIASQSTIYCMFTLFIIYILYIALDRHKIQCYTVLVIDFCASPLWSMDFIPYSRRTFCIAHAVKFVFKCQWITAPFGRFCLLALFYIDINANGRKECYGTYPSDRLYHRQSCPTNRSVWASLCQIWAAGDNRQRQETMDAVLPGMDLGIWGGRPAHKAGCEERL